ncbi:MAG: tetratricopeptide repeat protein [Acidobacteria bacterium]|nr:tetratricopeptide repeat protein [Acidobacteriota bacterium]
MDWPKAIQAFTVAIESDPRSAALFFYRGQANYFAGNFKTAADDLSRAAMFDSRAGVRVKPQLDAAREIASLLPVQKVPVNTEKRSLEASLAANGLLIQRSVKVFNKEPQAAIDALDSQILERINEAIRINKYNSHAYSTRASYYKALKKHNNALIEYTKAIAIDPSPAPTYVSRGNLYAEMKNYQFAIADFSKAIESDHNAGAFNSSYYTARADAYEKAGEKEKALRDLTTIIDTKPKDSFGYGMRASFYLRQKENAKALADLNKAIELDPKDASSRLSRCRFYNETKRFAAAADDCTVAIDKKEFILSDLAITERAVAYTGLKKYDLAMADLAVAEKSEYTSKAEIFGQRGVIYAAQGKKVEAEAAFNTALKEDPKNRIALDGLKALK